MIASFVSAEKAECEGKRPSLSAADLSRNTKLEKRSRNDIFEPVEGLPECGSNMIFETENQKSN